MKGKAALIFQHGCTRRKLDMDIIHKYLQDNGWVMTSEEREADVIVVSTCAYDEVHENQAVEMVRKCADVKRHDCRLVVVGCLGGIRPDRLRGIAGLETVTPKDFYRIDDVIEPAIKIREITDLAVAKENLRNPMRWWGRQMTSGQEKATDPAVFQEPLMSALYAPGNKLIRIANGCKGRCSYCAIRFATGDLVSKKTDEILLEVEHTVASGYQMITFVAEDIGCYGLDSGTSFVRLLEETLRIGDGYKVELHATNIQWIIRHAEGFKALLKQNPGRFSQLFIPIQSGSNKILDLMERQYTIEDAMECLWQVKAADECISITTDMMVGFPSETQKDFEQTIEAARSFPFHQINVFKYHNKPNTKAARLPNQVDDGIKEARYRLLQLACGRHLKKPF